MKDNREIVFACDWFSVEAQNPPRSQGAGDQPFYKINLPDGVLILPITEDGRLVLVRQYRPALDRVTIEMPAGAVDPGEDPAVAAEREAYEETGYRSPGFELVGSGVIRTDREDARNYYFIAPRAVLDPAFRPEEGINPFVVTAEEFRQLMAEDRFDHITALAIFAMAESRLGRRLI